MAMSSMARTPSAEQFRGLLDTVAAAARRGGEDIRHIVPHSAVLADFDEMIKTARTQAKIEVIEALAQLVETDDELGDSMDAEHLIYWLRYLSQNIDLLEGYDQ